MNHLRKVLYLEVIFSSLALIVSIFALFQARESNLIARLSLPSVKILTVETHPIISFLPNGNLVTVCRTQLQLANTGGSGTSIIGIQPIGDFNREGYLPNFGQRIVRVEVSSRPGVKLFNMPFPTAIKLIDKAFAGPIPYQISLTKRGDPSPLLNDASFKATAIKTKTNTYELSDLVQKLRGKSNLGNWLSQQVTSEQAAPQVEPFGLPIFIPENAIQILHIDFRYVVPKEFDLSEFSTQRRLARDGINPEVAYRLSFPDIPSAEVAPHLCNGTITIAE